MLEDPVPISALSNIDLLPDNLLWGSCFDSRRVVVRTHAFTSDWAISFVNLLEACSLERPSIAPPSSILALKKSDMTWICCRVRKVGESAEIMVVR